MIATGTAVTSLVACVAILPGGEIIHARGRHAPLAPPEGRGTVVYSNVTYDTGTYCDFLSYEGGDGLSMTGSGKLVEFTVAWKDPPDGVAAAAMYVRFYAGPALEVFVGDGTDVPLLTFVDPAPPGEGSWLSTYSVADGVVLPAELVVTVQWEADPSADGIGLRVMDPPTVGSSADWYYLGRPDGFWWSFDGDPVANFGFEMVVDGQTTFPKADLDCNGVVNAFDIDPFVLALVDAAAYALAHPDCDIDNADVNGDGAIDAFDIGPFVECVLLGGCP